MKHTRKLASLLLALVMVFALATTAFAATVTVPSDGILKDHTFTAYQIFSGREEGGILSDVQWGSGINSDAFLAALKDDTTCGTLFADCVDAAAVAEVLGKNNTNTALANAVAKLAYTHKTGSGTALISGENDLADGYYLIVDTTTNVGEGGAYNKALLQVVGDISIATKTAAPSVDKSVKDTDNKWGESADWEIGSDVPFQLVGTLPSNYADYETYKYVFHDELQNTLKYNGNVKVYVQNDETKKEITAGFTVDPSVAATAGGGTLTVTFDDLKAVTNVSATSKIIVEYTAELLSTAEIGQPGNKNEVYLEYSNNPNQTGEGTPSTGNTPKDEVLVFTYELDVTKVDGQDSEKKLANAEFVLLNSDKTKVAKVAGGKFVEWVAVTTAEDGTTTYPAGTTLTSASDGKFVIAGLDAGSYYLRETKAPAGYNLLKNDIAVTITATLDKSEDNPALTALNLSVKEDKEGATDAKSDGVLDTGVVSTNVENNSGTQLPETGGIGTTIFYVLGSVLVLAAVVLLVTKKRMSTND